MIVLDYDIPCIGCLLAGFLEASWGVLEAFWAVWRPILGRLGAILGYLGGLGGLPGPSLKPWTIPGIRYGRPGTPGSRGGAVAYMRDGGWAAP